MSNSGNTSWQAFLTSWPPATTADREMWTVKTLGGYTETGRALAGEPCDASHGSDMIRA
jgi:hypothetical protein